MVDGDALEMRFGETQRGFESPPLRLTLISQHSTKSEVQTVSRFMDKYPK